jgi:hypothetical protein
MENEKSPAGDPAGDFLQVGMQVETDNRMIYCLRKPGAVD